MEFENQAVAKTEYKSFKEAFAALPEALRQHSIRVAEYSRVLFFEAIATEFRVGSDNTLKLRPEYERAAYLCGLYHDIGKVLVPEQYHTPSESFGEEETALYRRHVVDGGKMADELAFGEPFSDIEKLMIKNALTYHHTNSYGTGFHGEVDHEREIPLMALIVGFSNWLDHVVTVRRSENPFDEVIEDVMQRFTEDTELLILIEESRHKLKKVFIKYQDQSLMIPNILPFAKRRPNRPFELKYRPIIDRKQKKTVGLEAKPYFKDGRDIYVEYDEVKTVLNKNKLHAEAGRYFLYEAADTVRRIKACELPIDYIAVELMPKYYTEGKVAANVEQLLSDSRLEKGRLYLAMDESMFENPSKALMTAMERMTKAEIPLFMKNYTGELLKAKELVQYSFKKAALHPSLYKKLGEEALQSDIGLLQEAGIEVIAGELERTKYNGMLNSLEITAMTGTLAGDYATEDETILGELALQR